MQNASSSRLPRILAIDDDSGMCELYKDHFSSRGFEVWTAANARDAIDLCARMQPHFIFLDLRMKGGSGIAAFPQLRAAVPSARIYVISGFRKELEDFHKTGLKPDAWFEKPVSLIELEEILLRELDPM